MFSHEEMIGLQAEKHELIGAENIKTKEDHVLHLVHTFAYVQASRLAQKKKVLDLGCNTGYGTEILSRSAKKVDGVDVSKDAISTAEHRYGHLGIEFKRIDGRQLPYKDNEFDIVVSFQVIEHIVDYGLYISELKRVLSPEGIVIFTTPNAVLRLDPGMKPWNKFHVREFNHTELKSLLRTFFLGVRVMGLFADEPLYSIEANRQNRARENARRNTPRTYIRSIVENRLPNSLLNGLRRMRQLFQEKKPAVEKEFANKYGVTDFYYLPNNLGTALDLLAICSDDNDRLHEVEMKLGFSEEFVSHRHSFRDDSSSGESI